jgi:hypothetical protein
VIELNADLTEVSRQIGALKSAAPKIVRRHTVTAFTKMGVELNSKFKSASPRFTGRLANSHGYVVKKDELRVIFFNRAAHAVYMHEGTNHSKMPPPDALRKWAARKLGNADLAFVVARAIKRRGGLKARKWMQIQFDQYQPKAVARMEEALDAIVREMETVKA